MHEKIVNQRNDIIHKLSRYYVNEYTLIAVEGLQIENMVRNHSLARSIMDASWSRFIQMLDTKAGSAGCRVMKVEPRNTSKKCSRCGTLVPKRLNERIHACRCGFIGDRDYNAACNILAKALGQELPEVTPVEIKTYVTCSSSRDRVWSLKQDAQPFRAE